MGTEGLRHLLSLEVSSSLPLSSNRETPGTQSHKEQSLGRSTKTSLTEQRVIKWQETDHREQKLWVLAETSLSTPPALQAHTLLSLRLLIRETPAILTQHVNYENRALRTTT